jgi:hypothetical protein
LTNTNYSSQLTLAQNQLTTTQNQLVTKQAQHDELLNRFTGLQIESNNKDKKIEKIGKENSELKEENIRIKLQSKEGKLEIFIREIGVDRMQIRKLRNAYQNLIKSSEVNRNNIFNDEEIEVIKDDLLEGKKISLENVQKLCSKCKKLAELRIEREKLHQRNFEAVQETSVTNR